jgi:hypothetical protein
LHSYFCFSARHYFTFSASDSQRVLGLPWFAVVDDKWRNTYADPFDCGPLPE